MEKSLDIKQVDQSSRKTSKSQENLRKRRRSFLYASSLFFSSPSPSKIKKQQTFQKKKKTKNHQTIFNSSRAVERIRRSNVLQLYPIHPHPYTRKMSDVWALIIVITYQLLHEQGGLVWSPAEITNRPIRHPRDRQHASENLIVIKIITFFFLKRITSKIIKEDE